MLEHEYLEYIPTYALGALSAPEYRTFEQHLSQGCDLCESELSVFQETVNLLPYALPEHKISRRLKESVGSRIDPLSGSSAAFSWNSMLKIAAVLAVIALGSAIYWKQHQRIALQDQQMASLKAQFREKDQEINWLRDPSVQLALLTGLQPASGAKGKMVWNQAVAKGMFYADSMPQLPSGKSYQLWVIGSKGPVSAGVFDPDVRGGVVLTITRIAGTAEGSLQFAVTIEPRGGLPQPSGTMILAGKPL